jgi:hypothetical protein
MAKKTTARSKPASTADVPGAAAPAVTPRRRAKAPTPDDTSVANDNAEATSSSVAFEPSEDDVKLRAYHRYLERGGGHGMDFEDWLEAKRDLQKK